MAPLLLRIRTKDGTERLEIESSDTLADLKEQIAATYGVPLEQQVVSRSEQSGPVPRKAEAFSVVEEGLSLSALKIGSGALLFLDYAVDRENMAQYEEKDPFKTLVQQVCF